MKNFRLQHASCLARQNDVLVRYLVICIIQAATRPVKSSYRLQDNRFLFPRLCGVQSKIGRAFS
eukprot:6194108-Pleurochrysis_carterae.AAC.1